MKICAQLLVSAALAAVLPAASTEFASLPLRFEQNRGQARAGADFIARGPGYSLLLSSKSMELRGRFAQTTVSFPGARSVAAEPEQLLESRSNYLLGKDASRWKTKWFDSGSERGRWLQRINGLNSTDSRSFNGQPQVTVFLMPETPTPAAGR